MKEAIVLVGAGGHCKIIIESLDKKKYDIAGILDNFAEKGSYICQVPVIGGDEDAPALLERGVLNAAVAVVGNLKIRRKLLDQYRAMGFRFPAIIHPSCRLSESAQIGQGAALLANSCINAEARIGDFATVNTGAIVEHEVSVGENSHIAPGAILLGGCKIGRETMVGAGSTILQQKAVGDHCMVGAGSLVLKDVEDGKTVFGNPAKEKDSAGV